MATSSQRTDPQFFRHEGRRPPSAEKLLTWNFIRASLICIGSDCEGTEGRPNIVHYNPVTKASPTSGIALLQLGIVQKMILPHKDLFKNEDELQAKGREVERVVWREELWRYSVKDVNDRAAKRIGEGSMYHLMKNNCESFVMRCICGLKISLQVTAKTSVVSSW